VAQALVLHDRARIHFGQLVILAIRQRLTVRAKFDPPVGILLHLDVSADELAVRQRVLEQVHHPVVLHRERLRHFAWLAPREQPLKVLIGA
jgi:hypothetical protein